jgi:hypothetical protein
VAAGDTVMAKGDMDGDLLDASHAASWWTLCRTAPRPSHAAPPVPPAAKTTASPAPDERPPTAPAASGPVAPPSPASRPTEQPRAEAPQQAPPRRSAFGRLGLAAPARPGALTSAPVVAPHPRAESGKQPDPTTAPPSGLAAAGGSPPSGMGSSGRPGGFARPDVRPSPPPAPAPPVSAGAMWERGGMPSMDVDHDSGSNGQTKPLTGAGGALSRGGNQAQGAKRNVTRSQDAAPGARHPEASPDADDLLIPW